MWLLRRHIIDMRFTVLGFGLTAAAMAVIDTVLFPSLRAQIGEFDYAGLGEALGATGSLAEPDQFFTTEFLSWVPLLMLVFAIRTATGLIAGEEHDGTLELLLAQPITRAALFAQRVAALIAGAALIASAAALGFAITWPFVTFDGISLGSLVGATYLMVPLVIAVGAFGFLAAALGSTKGQATGIATSIAVMTYVMFVLSLLENDVEWLRFLTPYYYGQMTTVLTQGFDLWRLIVLAASTTVFLGVALWAFERRDIGTGQSPLGSMLRFRLKT